MTIDWLSGLHCRCPALKESSFKENLFYCPQCMGVWELDDWRKAHNDRWPDIEFDLRFERRRGGRVALLFLGLSIIATGIIVGLMWLIDHAIAWIMIRAMY